MMLAKIAGFLFILFSVSNSLAAVDILIWQPTPQHPKFILPLKAGETSKQAIERYRSLLYHEVYGDPHVFENADGRTEKLSAGQDKVIFIANNLKDHFAGETRATKFMSHFSKSDNFVLLLGAAERLKAQERKEFYQLLTKKFAGLVTMGGDDVAPKMYQEEVTYARNFNETRDRLEIELIQTWAQSQKGFLFGVCRGHQMTSVAFGAKLIQDIPAELPNSIKHADHIHSVDLKQTSQGLLQNMLQQKNKLEVYSWHHQSVKYQSNPYLELAATSTDGVVEALEFKNGKGLIVQFHPELHPTVESKAILNGVWTQIRKHVQTFSCGRVFQ